MNLNLTKIYWDWPRYIFCIFDHILLSEHPIQPEKNLIKKRYSSFHLRSIRTPLNDLHYLVRVLRETTLHFWMQNLFHLFLRHLFNPLNLINYLVHLLDSVSIIAIFRLQQYFGFKFANFKYLNSFCKLFSAIEFPSVQEKLVVALLRESTGCSKHNYYC